MSSSKDPLLVKRPIREAPTPPRISSMDKARIENEMDDKKNKNTPKVDPDLLRLHDAVYDPDNIDEVKELLEESEELVFQQDDEGRTPLHTLCLAGDEEGPEIAKLLLGIPESLSISEVSRSSVGRPRILNLKDAVGFTPLHYAARNLHPPLVDLLLRSGADASLVDVGGNTPLHYAAEGNNDEAIECSKELLKRDTNGSMINCKNNDELTPLHKAVQKEAVRMIDLLINGNYKVNLSATNKLGQNIFHYICLEPGDTDKSCEITKAIVKVSNSMQLNHPDANGQTALHLASIERYPGIVQILVDHPETDLMLVDKRKRLALHYAAENGRYPEGYQCVEALISRKFTDASKLIAYMYQMKDDMEQTPFMIACINCPISTMEKYLKVIPDPQFWMKDPSMFYLIYKNSPSSIKALYDEAFSDFKLKTKGTSASSMRNAQKDDFDDIYVDFGPITGYEDPVEKLKQQETKYLKQALWWDFDTQKDILLHPLVQLFMVKKWQKLKYIIMAWIACQLIWLCAYTSLAITTYSNGIDSKTLAWVASIIMLIYVIASFINEFFEMCMVGSSYFQSITNLTQILQNVLAIFAILPLLTGSDTPSALSKYAASMGILLAYILSMRDIGKLHNMSGLVVEVLKQVVVQILKVLLCCSPLLIGFTLAFIIIFDNEESLTAAFPGPFVKVLVMMTGEFEYNDTFNGEDDKNKTAFYRVFRLVFFLSFLIAVPVAFFNLLTGFALDKVMELRERAKVGRVAKQLEHIYFIESLLLNLHQMNKIFRGTLPFSVVSWLRKLNVTTAIINGQPAFEFQIKEQFEKKQNRKPLTGRRLDALWRCGSIVCETDLPTSVRNDIYRLASKPGNDKPSCPCTCGKCS